MEIEQATGWAGDKGHTPFRVKMLNRDDTVTEHTSTYRNAEEARLFWLNQHQVLDVLEVVEVKGG